MSKIALVIPGNTFHANQPSETMALMDSERYGLPVFRRYSIPATCFLQGADLLMKPWLREEMSTPGSIEWGNAPFSHTLMPWAKKEWRREVRDTLGTVPVTFFSEFYVPNPEQIPTEFTLVLGGASVLYSASADAWLGKGCDIDTVPYPESAEAIRFGGKVGILMRSEWFAPLLSAFFLFQRFPFAGSHPDGRDTLAELVAEVKKVKGGPTDRVVVCPVDMEAPWVGSCVGALAWELFFERLTEEGLTDVFTPLSSHLARFREEAVSAPRPHRELTKWSCWQLQLDHLERLQALAPRGEREMKIKMIATGSDIYAAWGIKLQETKKKIVLPAVEIDLMPVGIRISYNQSVIDVQHAAYMALKEATTFASELEKLKEPDYFITLALMMAEREGF